MILMRENSGDRSHTIEIAPRGGKLKQVLPEISIINAIAANPSRFVKATST